MAREFYRGAWGSIRLAQQADKESLFESFIEKQSSADQLKLFALLKRAAEMGPMNICDGEKFKKLEGTLFEFKSHQIRVPCFYDGRQIVLTHAFRKKKDRTPPEEIERARRIMSAYFESQQASMKKRNK